MRDSWQQQIIKNFDLNLSKIILIADPDELLFEDTILQSINENGFELITIEDIVAFRYAYESKYRSHWDNNENIALGVVLRTTKADLDLLPYDLLQASKKLTFNLGDLFPNLSYPIIASLSRDTFDAIYLAQKLYINNKLGDTATKDFLLRHVFDIAPEMLKQESDLLRILLRKHYRGQSFPAILNERLIQILGQNSRFTEWPLEKLVPNKEYFLHFLQTNWEYFINKKISNLNKLITDEEMIDLPFDHSDVRVYIDTLFLEGYLKPIAIKGIDLSKSDINPDDWIMVGLQTDPKVDRLRRLQKLIESIENSLPDDSAKYQDWFSFVHGWGELAILWHEISTDVQIEIKNRYQKLEETVDKIFVEWVLKRFGTLHNQPAIPPVMLHHIPRSIAKYLEEDEKNKAALIVLDGMSFDQWLVLKESILQQRPNLKIHEDSVFCWVPTITSVSRQSIFAGKPPVFFPECIYTTNKEASLWNQFWTDRGLRQNEIAYLKGLRDKVDLSDVEPILLNPKIRIAGLVVDKVDKIMHGMMLGTAGMYNQIRQWVKEGFLLALFEQFINKGFQIFLTSDHGNIEAKGCGSPSEGSLADVRGERVRIYSDQNLRAQTNLKFPNSIEWYPLGLPENFLPLLAPRRQAFVREKERIVTHGGISIEEMIVPLAYVS